LVGPTVTGCVNENLILKDEDWTEVGWSNLYALSSSPFFLYCIVFNCLTTLFLETIKVEHSFGKKPITELFKQTYELLKLFSETA